MRTWLQGSIADVAWCILTCSLADSIPCGQMLSTSIQILCQAFIHMGFIFIRDKGFNESRSQSWHAACIMHVSCDVIQCVFSGTLPFCQRSWLHGPRSFQQTPQIYVGYPRTSKIKGLKTDFFHQLLGNCLGYVWDYVDSLVQTGTTRCNEDRSHVPKPLPTLVLTRGMYSLAGAGSRGYTGDTRRHSETEFAKSELFRCMHFLYLSIQCEIMWGYGALITSRVCNRYVATTTTP